jgi:hypothetical protein
VTAALIEKPSALILQHTLPSERISLRKNFEKALLSWCLLGSTSQKVNLRHKRKQQPPNHNANPEFVILKNSHY